MKALPRRQRAVARSVARFATGFSLIEAMVALALTAVLAMGVLPLFTMSMSNNVEGNQLTEVTSRARVHLEHLLGLPFDSPLLTVPPGAEELSTAELWSVDQEVWLAEDDFPVNETPLFSRTTRVRQFNLSAVSPSDQEFDDDEVVLGGTTAALAQIKEIEVRVNTGRPSTMNLMGRGKAITLRVLKSF